MTIAALRGAISRVALDVPLRRLFDYRVPEDIAAPAPGTRVRVPFGRQRLIGVVVEQAQASSLPEGRLKYLAEVLDTVPVLGTELLDLVRWASDYYHHPIGEVIASALPKALRAGASAVSRRTLWSATPAGQTALLAGSLARAPAQRQLLELLIAAGALSEADLLERLPRWRTAAQALQQHGWVQHEWVEAARAAPAAALPARDTEAVAPVPTPEQAQAVAAINAALGGFATFVLHGLTGSGKTEVYLQVIRQVLASGRRALVLVPEIGLTPQLVRRFQARLDAPLAVLHSALTDSERLRRLARRCQRPRPHRRRHPLGGVRTVPDLGVIIVDEEHDSSLKQHEGGFRYSARDLALVRAQRAQVPVVLGSATPSLETLQQVAAGRYRRLSLPRRAGQAAAPRLALVDLRAHAVSAGLATPVVQAIERHLKRGRPGAGVPEPARLRADAVVYRLRLGRAVPRLRRAPDGASARGPAALPSLRRRRAAAAALPAMRVRAAARSARAPSGSRRRCSELFPQAALARLDRDVVRGARRHGRRLDSVNSGAARILVGTQMITKGHHFQNMTLVVMLNADQGLFSTDFRAAERLAQTIVQVAGRAGRGSRAGEVLIQTAYPEHPLLQQLLANGLRRLCPHGARRAREPPPGRRSAAWPCCAPRPPAPKPRCSSCPRHARRPAPARAVKLLGPVPAAMARRAGRYHAQLLLESTDRAALHRLLGTWLEKLAELPGARRVRWALDVDPIDLF